MEQGLHIIENSRTGKEEIRLHIHDKNLAERVRTTLAEGGERITFSGLAYLLQDPGINKATYRDFLYLVRSYRQFFHIGNAINYIFRAFRIE